MPLQLAQFGTQMLAYPRIERRHRFIQQQQRRCRRQGSGQGHALLLAARKLAGKFFLAAGQANQFQHLPDPLAHFVAATAGQAIGNVGFDAQVGEQGVGLEQNPVVARLRWQGGNVTLADEQLATVLPLEPGNAPQQRGLAATGRPQQAHQLTGSDLEGDVIEGGECTEALVDAAHFHVCARVYDRVVHGRASSSR
ncbi:hypothetical protein D3C84_492730 [compost metagenome]